MQEGHTVDGVPSQAAGACGTSRHPLQERVPVSMVSVRSAIAKALETPQGRPAVSKAEASTITRAG